MTATENLSREIFANLERRIVKTRYSSQGTYLLTPEYTETVYREKSLIVFKAKWENRAVEKTYPVDREKIEKYFDAVKSADSLSPMCMGACDCPEENFTMYFDDRRSKKYSIIGFLPETIYSALDMFKKERKDFEKWADGVLGFERR